MSTEKESYEGWSIIELLGHVRLGGYVRETELAGHGVLRIDVPEVKGYAASTQFVSPASLYRLTPTTEEIAKAVAATNHPEPVSRWQLPAPEPQEGEATESIRRHGADCCCSACEMDEEECGDA